MSEARFNLGIVKLDGERAVEVELVSIALAVLFAGLPLLSVDDYARRVVIKRAELHFLCKVVNAVRTGVGSGLACARVL